MRLADVQQRASEVRACGDDVEERHYAEDALFVDLLRAIAAGDCTAPAACARLCVALYDANDTRWFS